MSRIVAALTIGLVALTPFAAGTVAVDYSRKSVGNKRVATFTKTSGPAYARARGSANGVRTASHSSTGSKKRAVARPRRKVGSKGGGRRKRSKRVVRKGRTAADGNEGDEGDEGDEGNEGNEGDEGDEGGKRTSVFGGGRKRRKVVFGRRRNFGFRGRSRKSVSKKKFVVSDGKGDGDDERRKDTDDDDDDDMDEAQREMDDTDPADSGFDQRIFARRKRTLVKRVGRRKRVVSVGNKRTGGGTRGKGGRNRKSVSKKKYVVSRGGRRQ